MKNLFLLFVISIFFVGSISALHICDSQHSSIHTAYKKSGCHDNVTVSSEPSLNNCECEHCTNYSVAEFVENLTHKNVYFEESRIEIRYQTLPPYPHYKPPKLNS